MAQELTQGITLFLRVKWSYFMNTSVRTHVTEFGGVSLTQLDLVKLVVSSLTD